MELGTFLGTTLGYFGVFWWLGAPKWQYSLQGEFLWDQEFSLCQNPMVRWAKHMIIIYVIVRFNRSGSFAVAWCPKGSPADLPDGSPRAAPEGSLRGSPKDFPKAVLKDHMSRKVCCNPPMRFRIDLSNNPCRICLAQHSIRIAGHGIELKRQHSIR